MNSRYVVAFVGRPVGLDLVARTAEAAVERAAAIEHARSPWPPGEHSAYFTDGESIFRAKLAVAEGSGAARFQAHADPGPIPAALARLMLHVWDDGA